jgi:hypothetical protein
MSTIKSSAEDLTLNADGSNEIKFQINAVEKASISSAGLLTSTTIDATALTGNLPAISGASLTGLTSAQMPAGSVLQVVSNTWTTATSVASTSYTSVGDSATSITPSATTSKILILVNFQAFIRFDDEGHQYASFEITRDTDTTVREFGAAIRELDIGFSWAGSPPGNTAKLWGGNFGMSFLDSPSSTSSLEYALTMKCLTTSSTGRVIVNEAGTGAASTITLMEIGA